MSCASRFGSRLRMRAGFLRLLAYYYLVSCPRPVLGQSIVSSCRISLTARVHIGFGDPLLPAAPGSCSQLFGQNARCLAPCRSFYRGTINLEDGDQPDFPRYRAKNHPVDISRARLVGGIIYRHPTTSPHLVYAITHPSALAS